MRPSQRMHTLSELLRTTGVFHVFPNGAINTLSNMTKEWLVMIYELEVAYTEGTDRVVDVMVGVAGELRADPEFGRKILEPIEILGVDSFGSRAVVIKARQKTRPIEQWSVGLEFRRRLKKAFDEKGIEIPFPQRSRNWGAASKPLVEPLKGPKGKTGCGSASS